MKCGRTNHQARDCKAPSQAKTPPPLGNANPEPVQKNRKFNKGHNKIAKIGLEEDSGNK